MAHNTCTCCSCRLAAAIGRLEDRLAALRCGRTAEGVTNNGPLSIADAAKKHGCSAEHLRRLAKRGEIRVTRLGRRVILPTRDIERLLAGE